MTKPILILLLLTSIPIVHKLYTTIRSTPYTEYVSVKHLAIIMDGNRRWAKERKQLAEYGHRKGTEKFELLIEYCLRRGIEMVSVYAWSLENFNRSPEEIQHILKILTEWSKTALPDLIKHGVKIRFVGDQKCFPETVRSTINHIEQSTAQGTKLHLNILFCYGGKQEIISAVNNIIKDVKAGKLQDVPSEEVFKKYLWTEDIPDPDLIIRTGGVKRLSNFLTYQTAYSELYFTDRFWPDITMNDLDAALREYAQRKRTFGK